MAIISRRFDTNKVKVSDNDTTPGNLLDKLAAGSNITLTETNDGANETVTIASTGGGGSSTAQTTRLERNAAQSLTTGLNTDIQFDNEKRDTLNGYNSGASLTNFVVPSNGFYKFTAQVGFAGNLTGQRIAGVSLGGAAYSEAIANMQNLSTSNTRVNISGGDDYLMGDVLTLTAFQNAGTTLSTLANETFLIVERIGD